eukprot:6207544-Pleurochrysis_carterae.AAC.1
MPSGMNMAGTPDESLSRYARQLEAKLKGAACLGFLARVRGSPDPRAMKASRPNSKGEKDKNDSDDMLAVTKLSGMSMAGTRDKSPSRDTQQLEAKDSTPSGLLARACRFPYSKAMEANELDSGRGDAQSYAQGALTVASIAEAAVDARLEPPSQEPCHVEAEDITRIRRLGKRRRSWGARHPCIGFKQDGGCAHRLTTAGAIRQSVTGTGRKRHSASRFLRSRAKLRESVESTPQLSAEPSALATSQGQANDEYCSALDNGPVCIKKMELLRDEAHPPKTSFDVTIAVRNLVPGNASWQSKFAAQHHRASVGRGRRQVQPRFADRWLKILMIFPTDRMR